MHHGKPIAWEAKFAVIVYGLESDSFIVDHILRNISSIAPVRRLNDHNDLLKINVVKSLNYFIVFIYLF